MSRFFFLALLLFQVIISACALHTATTKGMRPGESGPYSIKTVDKLSIPMSIPDAVLHGNAIYPVPKTPGERFPLIVMPISWGGPKFQYFMQMITFSSHGYVTVEYSTRGWTGNNGTINVGGPEDQQDTKDVLTYILQRKDEWHINTSAIGFFGISYGAGIGLMAAGIDDRVHTVVSVAGWANLTTSLYLNSIGNLKSAEKLTTSGKKGGKMMPEALHFPEWLRKHEHIDRLKVLGNERSPEAFLDSLNRRNIPVFFSNNNWDHYFEPQSSIALWRKLNVSHKFFLLNKGHHVFAEVIGLIPFAYSYIWLKTYQWFDQVLKGIDTGIFNEPSIQLQISKGPAILKNSVYLQFRSDNVINPSRNTFLYALGPRGNSHFGDLIEQKQKYLQHQPPARKPHMVGTPQTPPTPAAIKKMLLNLTASVRGAWTLADIDRIIHEIDNIEGMHAKGHGEDLLQAASPNHGNAPAAGDNTSETIQYTTSPPIHSGTFVSDMSRSMGFPTTFSLVLADWKTSLIYHSSLYWKKHTLCGMPQIRNLSFRVANAVTGAPTERFQVFAMLFDENAIGIGALLSDAVYGRYEDDGPLDRNMVRLGPGHFRINKWDMRPICTEITPTHRVALGFTIYDDRYAIPLPNITLTIDYDSKPIISVPDLNL